MRVDSENLSAGPIERVLVRFGPAATVAVYAVPDPRSGDQVMAALELLPGQVFDARGVRLVPRRAARSRDQVGPVLRAGHRPLPQTASGKVTKEPLRADGWWRGEDEVFRRRGTGPGYLPMDDADRRTLRAEFERHGRDHLVGG